MSESAYHSTHRPLHPPVLCALAAACLRRTATLYERRAAEERGSGSNLIRYRRASPIAESDDGEWDESRIQYSGQPQILVEVFAHVDRVHDDPEPPIGDVFAGLPPTAHQAVTGQRGIEEGKRRVQASRGEAQDKGACHSRGQRQ